MYILHSLYQFICQWTFGLFLYLSVVQSLSHVQLFATPWTIAHQASRSFTISWSSLKLMSVESVMPSNHLIFCHPLLFPAFKLSQNQRKIFFFLGFFLMSQLFAWGSQSIGASASASVLPMNIQGLFPLELTGLISLLSKGLSRVFSNTTVWKHRFFPGSIPGSGRSPGEANGKLL